MNVWDACKDGRFDFVKYLLEHDPKQANLKDENDVTPLAYAVIGNQPHIAKLLIQHEAKVNTPSKTSLPLLFAAMNGNVAMVELLLGADSLVRKLNKHGMTPFHAAVAGGGSTTPEAALKMAKLMLAKDPDVLNFAGPSVGTALHSAISNGNANMELIKFLVESGADTTLKIADTQRTALHCAAGVKNAPPELLEYLLEHGAKEVIDERDSQSLTAVDIAALKRRKEACETLIKAGADLSGKTQEQGMTPLCYAVQAADNLEIVKLFHAAGNDCAHVTTPQATPMHLAASLPRCEATIQYLLDNGAGLNTQDCDGNTPAHYAAINECEEGFKVLLSKGADVNIQNNKGHSAADLFADWQASKQGLGQGKAEAPIENLEDLKTCATCGKREEKPNQFKRCSRCKKVNYCSQGCQLRDWKQGHSKSCTP